ncbi:cytochrome c biogenesis protein CcdA [Candidatus Woesearchaeota archaeon]|nr:cytochrome c biogenesis protein CcdA [Candidatus Woesearchaeota archaeon]
MKTKNIVIFLFLVLLFIPIAYPQQLPQSLLNAMASNQQDAEANVRNISFLIAFLAGFISLLSPCTATTLPAFFAFTFKEKKDIFRVMLAFSAGFMTVFIALGLIAAYIGKSFLFLQEESSILPQVSGLLLIALGIMLFFGKGFSSFIKPGRFRHDYLGMYLLGMFFVVGWSACLGPILVGILVMATYLHNFFYATLLFFFYGIGILVPLFIIAGLYDRYDLGSKPWMRGKTIYLGRFAFNSSNMLGGLLLIAMGVIIYVYRGTWKFNAFSMFGGKLLFYDWQRKLFGSALGNILGGLLLAAFIILMVYFWRRSGKARQSSKQKDKNLKLKLK